MVTDHTNAENQLKQIAETQDVTLPGKLSQPDQATKDRLEKLHGAAFDKAYMHDMVTDHEHDVADFRGDEKTIKDTQLKDWVINTLPTLDSHLGEAKRSQKRGGDDGRCQSHREPATVGSANHHAAVTQVPKIHQAA